MIWSRLEFPAFLGVALGLHILVWPSAPSGTAGAGQDGADAISLVASSASMSEMVAQWDTPPEVPTTTQLSPPSPDTAPDITVTASRVPLASQPAQPAVPTEAPVPPLAETTLPTNPRIAVAATPSVTPPDIPAAPELTAQSTPRQRPGVASPVAPQQPGTAPTPPEIDTTTPTQFAGASSLAPARSLRPADRPDDLAPPPRQTPPPRAQPAPNTAAQPAQTARGTGDAETAGRNQPTPSQGPSAATVRSLMAQWGSGVRRAIERRKRYPRGTRASGRVRVAITLTTNGDLVGVGLAASSGDANLDQAALSAVRNARYPRAPQGLGAGRHSFTVPLSFSP